MPIYRKKPVEVEAVLWTGENCVEIIDFCGADILSFRGRNLDFIIGTLEGVTQVSVGDFVIKGVAGEFYPCKPDIFSATYEQVA